MRIKLNRTNLLRLACLLILVIAVSFGAAELLLIVDLGGIEFAVTFLLAYFASIRQVLAFKYRMLKSDIRQFVEFLSELYMFRPKVFISHVSATGVLVALTCSVFLACLFWVPVVLASAHLAG